MVVPEARPVARRQARARSPAATAAKAAVGAPAQGQEAQAVVRLRPSASRSAGMVAMAAIHRPRVVPAALVVRPVVGWVRRVVMVAGAEPVALLVVSAVRAGLHRRPPAMPGVATAVLAAVVTAPATVEVAVPAATRTQLPAMPQPVMAGQAVTAVRPAVTVAPAASVVSVVVRIRWMATQWVVPEVWAAVPMMAAAVPLVVRVATRLLTALVMHAAAQEARAATEVRVAWTVALVVPEVARPHRTV